MSLLGYKPYVSLTLKPKLLTTDLQSSISSALPSNYFILPLPSPHLLCSSHPGFPAAPWRARHISGLGLYLSCPSNKNSLSPIIYLANSFTCSKCWFKWAWHVTEMTALSPLHPTPSTPDLSYPVFYLFFPPYLLSLLVPYTIYLSAYYLLFISPDYNANSMRRGIFVLLTDKFQNSGTNWSAIHICWWNEWIYQISKDYKLGNTQ